MKKILLIALSFVLILSSFLLTSCDTDDPKQQNKQETEQTEKAQETQKTQETQKPNTDTEKKPSGPVRVDSVNGMDAKQLFEKFMSDYKQSDAFDISMSMRSTENGITTTEHMDLKVVNGTGIYIDMLVDDQAMKIWLVDNTIYFNTEEGKYKASNTGIEDVLGEDFLDRIMAEVPTDVPEEYIEKLETAQIYFYEDTYYFTVTVNDEEAEEMGSEEKEYTETLYFDSMGTLKKIVDTDADSNEMTILISYNKPVVINKPIDADEYIEVEEDTENENSQAYAVYDQLCDTIENAVSYTMYVDVNDTPIIFYETDGQNEHVEAYDDTDDFYNIWIVNGQGYISKNDEDPVKTDVTSDMLQSMAASRSMKDIITDNRISEDDMIDLALSQGPQDSHFLVFEVNTGIETSDIYTFTFYEQSSDILLNICSMKDEIPTDDLNYYFLCINDSYKIFAPI